MSGHPEVTGSILNRDALHCLPFYFALDAYGRRPISPCFVYTTLHFLKKGSLALTFVGEEDDRVGSRCIPTVRVLVDDIVHRQATRAEWQPAPGCLVTQAHHGGHVQWHAWHPVQDLQQAKGHCHYQFNDPFLCISDTCYFLYPKILHLRVGYH